MLYQFQLVAGLNQAVDQFVVSELIGFDDQHVAFPAAACMTHLRSDQSFSAGDRVIRRITFSTAWSTCSRRSTTWSTAAWRPTSRRPTLESTWRSPCSTTARPPARSRGPA